jgi:branched-chain amino acid transport system ATP-binding protein
MLRIESVRSGYGPVEIIHGIDLQVPAGKIVGLLGANGSGKTTLFRTISGLVKIHSGKIYFCDQDTSSLKSQDIARLGISHVPQGRLLFSEMSVYENLEVGSLWLNQSKDFQNRLQMVEQLFPILKERRHQISALLSGGEQQMLAIARALMANPKLILLDEPSVGLAPKIFDQILQTVKKINHDSQTTVLISEQNVRKMLQYVDYAYVLENGNITIEGVPEELKGNIKIQQSYLGF